MRFLCAWLSISAALLGCQQSPPPPSPLRRGLQSSPPRILRAEGTAKNRSAHLARQTAYHRAVAQISAEINGVQVTEENSPGERVVHTRTEGTVQGAQIEREWTDEDGTVHVRVRVEVPQH